MRIYKGVINEQEVEIYAIKVTKEERKMMEITNNAIIEEPVNYDEWDDNWSD